MASIASTSCRICAQVEAAVDRDADLGTDSDEQLGLQVVVGGVERQLCAEPVEHLECGSSPASTGRSRSSVVAKAWIVSTCAR